MAVASLKSWDNFILEFSKITPESAHLSMVNPDYAQEKETAKFTYHEDIASIEKSRCSRSLLIVEVKRLTHSRGRYSISNLAF